MLSVNEEFANYLKSKNYNRLMDSLKEKYIKLSRPSGSIILMDIAEKEALDIGNLLGKKVLVGSDLKITFKELTKKIQEGKYRDFNWIDTFNYYYNEIIITKQTQTAFDKNEEENFYERIFEENKNSAYINEIMNLILNDEKIKRIVKSKYKKNKIELKKEIENVLLLLNNIPKEPISLPIYASITGNPHYLDFNKSTSNLFLKVLSQLKGIEYTSKTEEKLHLLEEINVYTDPISNFVITYKLLGNDTLNLLEKNNQILNMNLLNIKDLKDITTKNKKVFIFENPSILLELKNLNVPIIITSGIPNLAFYNLIKKLISSGNELYYNGDFDPEGLIIADNLKKKYADIKLFCYSNNDYKETMSKEKINDARIKKLEKVSSLELQEIKKILIKMRVAGYQEQNLNAIKKFILSK